MPPAIRRTISATVYPLVLVIGALFFNAPSLARAESAMTSVTASQVVFTTSTQLISRIVHPIGSRLADLDGDGDFDVVNAIYTDSKVAWYENTGVYPLKLNMHVITTDTLNAHEVYVADLNGDSRPDILSASPTDNKIAWFENTGTTSTRFVEHVISTSANGAWDVCAADLNGDGRIDPISTSIANSTLAWYCNDGGNPTTFTRKIITSSLTGASYAATADLDGDRDIDIVAAGYWGTQIVWLENGGGVATTFTQHVLDTQMGHCQFVATADVDGDGDQDILASSETSSEGVWYENLGGRPPTFARHVFSKGIGYPEYIAVADMNGDGKMDLVLSNQDGKAENITAFINNGDLPPTFTTQTLAWTNGCPCLPLIADMNHDGRPDILTNFYSRRGIYYFENRTAQPVAMLAPAGGGNYKSGTMLRVRWKTQPELAGNAVVLEVWRVGNYLRQLMMEDARPDGEDNLLITVPELPTGNGYSIRAISIDHPELYSDSYSTFSIQSGAANGAGKAWALYE